MLFVTVTMAVNSLEPTIFSVILWFIWFSTLFDKDFYSFDFVIFVVDVVLVAFIVIENCHLGTDGNVIIPPGALICFGGGISGQEWRLLSSVSGCQSGRGQRRGTVYIS